MLVRADLLGQFANRIDPLLCFGHCILQHVPPIKPDGEEIEGQAVDGRLKNCLALRQFFFGPLSFGDFERDERGSDNFAVLEDWTVVRCIPVFFMVQP